MSFMDPSIHDVVAIRAHANQPPGCTWGCVTIEFAEKGVVFNNTDKFPEISIFCDDAMLARKIADAITVAVAGGVDA